jgi:hypothetical protein
VDVVTYKPQTAKLVVVSVNGNATSTNELKAYLNDVYGKIGVTFEVETDTFTYNNAINFFDQSSGWFSRYTAAMKAFNIAYRNNTGGRYDSDKNYLFVLGEDVSRSDRDAQGFMPLGGRFGYLFKNQIPDNQINSIAAHELGHGVWALKHTFDNDYGNIAVNTTDNLMDYTPQANHLAKWQWEIIRYPALFTDPFGGDEEAMASSEIFEFEKVSGKINLDEIKYKKFIEEATLYYKAYNANGNNTSASNYLNKSLYIKLDGEIYKTNSVSTIFGRDRSDAYIGRFSGIYEIGEEEILQLLGQADYVFYDYGLTQVKEIVVYNESVGRDKLLDYKYEAYRILSGLYPNDLILIDGVVYNANEAGNYIWGMVLTYHGIFISPNLIAELGTRGRKDEPWEQRSITLGVEKADKEYINLPQQVKETILNYRLLFRSIYGEEDKTWRELNY